MTWASHYIHQLQLGKSVSFRPRGSSMQPKINSGELVTVKPIQINSVLSVGEIVLCTVRGKDYLHLISAVRSDGQYQISNNRGYVNGWTTKIYGIVAHIEK